VVLGSLTGYIPSRGFSAYSASKAAVNGYVETLAYEERVNGIQVLLVAPNAVKTPLLAQAADGPKLISKLDGKASSPMMLTTDDVLDSVDRALAAGRWVVTPGGRVLYGLRRLTPSGMWALGERMSA
jgi:short-subunit dehydrogenase